MRDLILFSIVALSAIGAFALSFKTDVFTTQASNAAEAVADSNTRDRAPVAQSPQQPMIIADGPPPEDAGTPGQRG